jgi:hypothetical protein
MGASRTRCFQLRWCWLFLLKNLRGDLVDVCRRALVGGGGADQSG